jgi:competence protein ComEA
MGCASRFVNLQYQISTLILTALLLCNASSAQTATPPQRLNLNTASAAQLETLSGIGPGLANRILEYRRKHGPFKRPQDLIIVRGFSAKRYRLLAHLLTV